MRVLFLTQWFEPEPAYRGLSFAKALTSAGHDVEVITGFPNYPTGKIYPSYKLKWYQKEIMDNVTINRVFLYPNHNSSAIKRSFNYLSFCISSCLFGLLRVKRPDVIYVYHPPITVGLSAVIISFFKRIPFVYDIQDLWPDTLKSTGMIKNDLILRLVAKICKRVYTSADRIIVSTPGFKKLLMDRGVSNHKLEFIYNWCDEETLLNGKKNGIPILNPNTFNVVFAGNIGKAQALDSVLEAAKIVYSRNNMIKFTIVGDGVELSKLRDLTSEMQLRNVEFLKQMPISEIGVVLNSADVLLVNLRDDPLFTVTIPSKTQAYMAIGKPVLMGVKGNAADLIQKAECGICVEPENPYSIADGIIFLSQLNQEKLRQLGKNGRDFYFSNMSFASGVNAIIQILYRVVH